MVLTEKKQNIVPRVLVLMATYNGAPWLSEQLASILSQKHVEVNVLIGDDVSKDATRHLIQEKWGSDARVRLKAWEHSSGSAGANFRRLYRYADPTGFDLIALADQDDIWASDKLARAAETLRDTGAAGYSCSVTSFWPDGRERVMTQCAATTGGDFLFEGAGQGCTFVVTAALFGRVREFCNRHTSAVETLHYHDWLIYLLSRAWGLVWYFDSQPHMRYRQHAGNEIGSRGGMTAVTKRIDLIRSGWYRRQVDAAAEIYVLANNTTTVIGHTIGTLRAKDTFSRRVKLAVFCLRNGRRRLSDRVVLTISAVAGWV